MENQNNPTTENPVTYQPDDIVKRPAADCTRYRDWCSTCWRTIFCCPKPQPPPVMEEIRTEEVHQEQIAPPTKFPLVQSAFPANMAGDIEDGVDDMSSEMSEDPETEDFIRGYSKNKLEGNHP